MQHQIVLTAEEQEFEDWHNNISQHMKNVDPSTVKFYDIEANWDKVEPILKTAVADKIIRRNMAKKSRDKRDGGVRDLIDGKTTNTIWLHHVENWLPEGWKPEMSDSCDWRYSYWEKFTSELDHIEWDEDTGVPLDEKAYAEAYDKITEEHPMPAFWDYVCHAACYYVADLNFYLANMLMPEEKWVIAQSDYHANVINESGTLMFDMNFLGLGINAAKAFELACSDESSYFDDWFIKCGHDMVEKVGGVYRFDADLIEPEITDRMAPFIDKRREELGLEAMERREYAR